MSSRSAWFRIEVYIPNNRVEAESKGEWVDITDNIDKRITLEESAELLDKLSFSLISTDTVSVIRFIDTLVEGMKVRAWFGYIDGTMIKNQEQEMFVGFIAKL